MRIRLTAPINRMRGFRQWQWHLDEMYVKVNGEMRYLWRAVDHEGEILESYVTKTRDKSAALAFMEKALKRHGSPTAIVTDGLRSYPAAMRALGNLDRQETGRWKNNRAENSHLPFRRRERAMLRFRRMKTLQKFVSVHANVHNHFNTERHLVDRPTYKLLRSVGPGRVARPHGLRHDGQRSKCAKRRFVRIRLTAPELMVGRLSAFKQPHFESGRCKRAAHSHDLAERLVAIAVDGIADVGCDYCHRFVGRHRRAVGAIRTQCVVIIAYSDDTSFAADLVILETQRVAGTIHPFMVRGGDRGHVGEYAHSTKDRLRMNRVLAHLDPFALVEGSRLIEDRVRTPSFPISWSRAARYSQRRRDGNTPIIAPIFFDRSPTRAEWPAVKWLFASITRPNAVAMSSR